MPCSFFAAWYSKFSDRSPKLRATAIASTAACALRALELGELGLELHLLRRGQTLAPLVRHRGRVAVT